MMPGSVNAVFIREIFVKIKILKCKIIFINYFYVLIEKEKPSDTKWTKNECILLKLINIILKITFFF